jgi:CHASE3 domain sensor protein
MVDGITFGFIVGFFAGMIAAALWIYHEWTRVSAALKEANQAREKLMGALAELDQYVMQFRSSAQGQAELQIALGDAFSVVPVKDKRH